MPPRIDLSGLEDEIARMMANAEDVNSVGLRAVSERAGACSELVRRHLHDHDLSLRVMRDIELASRIRRAFDENPDITMTQLAEVLHYNNGTSARRLVLRLFGVTYEEFKARRASAMAAGLWRVSNVG